MYEVRYACNNCGHTFAKSFQRGMKAPDKVECVRCGCFSARKTWRLTSVSWDWQKWRDDQGRRWAIWKEWCKR